MLRGAVFCGHSVHRTLLYVNVYGSYKLSKQSVFWPTLYIIVLYDVIFLMFT